MKRFVLSAVAAASFVGSAQAATFNVAGPTDPQWATLDHGYPSVLRKAKSGDTILLGAGTYGDIRLKNNWIAPGITIQSAPGAAVVIGWLGMESDGKGPLDNWTVKGDPASGGTLKISGSVFLGQANGATITDAEIAPNTFPADLTELKGGGVVFRAANHVTLARLDVHHWQGAVIWAGAQNVSITDSKFHDTSDDIFHLFGEMSNILIRGNELYNGWAKVLVHMDAMQFNPYGPVSATGPMDNIQILDNVIRRGDGVPLQGVFMNGDARTPYTHLVVRGNAIMEGNYWGIGVQNAPGVVIDHNFVGGFTDAKNGKTVMSPWIRVTDTAGATVTNNVVTQSISFVRSTDVKQSHNVTNLRLSSPKDEGAMRAWLAKRDAP